MLVSFDGLLDTKKLRYQLILSRDNDDQKILHSDWVRGIASPTQTKVAVQILPSRDIQKMILLEILMIIEYCNMICWEDLRPQLKAIMFSQNQKEHLYAPFLRSVNGSTFWCQSINFLFEEFLGHFLKTGVFLKKIHFVSFWPLKSYNCM